MRILVCLFLFSCTTSAFPFGLPSAFRSALKRKDIPKLQSSTLQESPAQVEESSVLQQDELLWKLLCDEAQVQPQGLLRLEESTEGVRGVYLDRHVVANDVVLSIPLNKCLRDDMPPSWMPVSDKDQDETSYSYGSDMEWATRLAASILELQQSDDSSIERHAQIWLSLLPDADLLRASLPIHWEEEVVQSTRCTALEVSVDSAYFSRANAIQDLEIALAESSLTSKKVDRRFIEDALDVVQTRTCRVDSEDGTALRLLAPVFDFLNHDSEANCGFQLEGDQLVVRSLVDISADQEVLIHYGESSTRPPWKCLVNYGFVPCPQGAKDDEPVAEVYMNGVRYEVGPTFIPEDMVAAALESSIVEVDDGNEGYIPSGQDVELTPEIAERLAHRLTEVSYHLLVDPPNSRKVEMLEDKEEEDDDEGDEDTAEMILSSQMAASLRWNQHRILLSCAQGLQEWALQQQAST